MERIQSRIAEARLTPKDRIVLDYMLKNQETACFMTAAELAKILGVSASSVVRVSSRLGYDNFSHFKRVLQEELAKSRKKERETIPYERIKNNGELSEEELIAAIKRNALRNVERDQASDDHQSYRRAAELIYQAEHVYVVGFRACTGFAGSLSVMLGCVRPGVFLVPGTQPVVDFLTDLTPRDVVVALSYERYSSDTVFAVKMAKREGSRVVALTDKYTSPICPGADAVILSSVENLSFYNSYTSVVMAMEVLTGLVSRKNQAQNEERLKKMEEYLRETGQY